MALMTAFGVWRLQTVAQATNEMTQQPLAVERMISDWYRYVYSAARRTSAIVKSTDPSLGQFFAADTATSTRESAELQSASRHCSPATRKRPCGPTSRRRA